MWGITRGPAPLFVNIMATKKKSKAGAAPERIRRNPERTRARILDAARVEFARRGLGGARVDQMVNNGNKLPCSLARARGARGMKETFTGG